MHKLPLTFILTTVSTAGQLSSEADTEFTVGLILWLERVNDPSAGSPQCLRVVTDFLRNTQLDYILPEFVVSIQLWHFHLVVELLHDSCNSCGLSIVRMRTQLITGCRGRYCVAIRRSSQLGNVALSLVAL
jgi:hypothetical protein